MRVFRVATTLPNARLDELDAVALRPSSVKSHEELNLAEHLARKTISQGKNIARQLRYEFLLWLAGKTDIKSAFATTAPRKNDSVIIVSFAEKLQLKSLALDLKTDADPLEIERISLSRARN